MHKFMNTNFRIFLLFPFICIQIRAFTLLWVHFSISCAVVVIGKCRHTVLGKSKARCRWLNGNKIMPLFCTNSTPLVCLFTSTRRRCYIFMFDWYSLKCNPIWTRKLKLNWCNLKSEVNIWLLTFSIYWIVFGFCCTLLLVHVETECFCKFNHLFCKKPYYMLKQVKWVSVT